MPPPRLHVPVLLSPQVGLALPPAAARHVQVLRLQPGDAITLFDDRGGEWSARVAGMGRQDVSVDVVEHHAVEREMAREVTLAPGMPANDRMDALVEKATELGATGLQPLVTERSVLRLAGERAERRREHWTAVAVSAAEQCGRTRVPAIAAIATLRAFLDRLPPPAPGAVRWLLAFGDCAPLATAAAALPPRAPVCILSGPEGGFSPDEEALAARAGFVRIGLGARVLRADTAPLAVLAHLAALDRPHV